MDHVSFVHMEDGTRQDYEFVERTEARIHENLAERVLAHFKTLENEDGPYRISRFRHCLQSATRAWRDGADEETIVAALLHDVGDVVAPFNHSEFAAAILKPYVSEKTCWIIKHHGLFQAYYYNHHLGGDRNVRDRFKDHPWYSDAVYFCHHYDQNSFDPDYDTLELEFFEPMVKRLFSKPSRFHRDAPKTLEEAREIV